MTTFVDASLISADSALRTLFAPHRAGRPTPTVAEPLQADATPLHDTDKRLSGALMRVNHVGEICAQALYTAQAAATRDPALRRHLEHAAREETDHLAWTRQRLDALGARPSLLNPLWYAGAFGLGLLAGRLGDRVIEGDAGFAADVAWLIDHLRWEAEEDLARLIGDAPAHQAMRAARALRQALQPLLGRLADVAGAPPDTAGGATR